MKTIEIEKNLGLTDAVDLLPMVMKEHFQYKKENDGIRCIGPFYMKGRYTTLNEVKDFQDVFEFDIFASNEKLDGETYRVIYKGYDYSISDGVTLYLTFEVHGVQEEAENQSEVEVAYEKDGKEVMAQTDTFRIPTYEDASHSSFHQNMNNEHTKIVDDQKTNPCINCMNFNKDTQKKYNDIPKYQDREMSDQNKVMRDQINAIKTANHYQSFDDVEAGYHEIPNYKEHARVAKKMDDKQEDHSKQYAAIPRYGQGKGLEPANQGQDRSSPMPKDDPVKEVVPVIEKVVPQEMNEKTVETREAKDEMKPTDVDDTTVDLKMMEELFDNKDHVISSYSFVVVRRNDTYASMAERYHVDVEQLRSINHNKEIHEKSLLVLPYCK